LYPLVSAFGENEHREPRDVATLQAERKEKNRVVQGTGLDLWMAVKVRPEPNVSRGLRPLDIEGVCRSPGGSRFLPSLAHGDTVAVRLLEVRLRRT
jgi:hypothetical protein